MAGGAAISGGTDAGFAHLVDPNKKWYNNRRLITSLPWL
ncbi:hypothetical protein MPER_07644 [Moniliophthora perniciosa FA553]|nr:hypothetical protein MPER_07644 [Moniliophthora perniciosa FA553]